MANEENGSFIKSLLVAAPVVAGVGVAGRRLLTNPTGYFNQPLTQMPVSPATNAIRKIVSEYADPQGSLMFREWQMKELMALGKSTPLTANQVREALMEATKVADPTGQVSLMFSKRLAAAGTGPQVIEDLRTILSQSNSIYAQRAVSIFMEDLEVLQRRVDAGLPIDMKELGVKIDRLKNPVTLEELEHLDARLTKSVQRIQDTLGGARLTIEGVGRKGLEGGELRFTFADSPKFEGKFTLRVPMSLTENPNLVVRGATQQSKYIAGEFGIVEQGMLKQSFKYEQWLVHRAETELVPKILAGTRGNVLPQRMVERLVSEFEKEMIEPLEWVPTFAAGEHKGVEEYIRRRSPIMRLYAMEEGALRPINEFEHYKIMEQGGLKLPEGGMKPLFPGASPSQIAAGVTSKEDIRQLLYLMPEAAPYGRRPLSAIRRDVEPLAPELIREDPTTKRFAWARAQAGVETPMVRAAYVSSRLGAEFAGTGLTAEGQGLITQRLDDIRAVKEWQQLEVSSKKLRDLAGMLDKETDGTWSINKTLTEEAYLGRGPGGRPVVVPAGTELVRATAFEADKAKGDFVRVMAKVPIEGFRYSKGKGGVKGMLTRVSDDYLEEIALGEGKMLAKAWRESGIDALTTMDELKKNRALHYNQMFTALWDFTDRNIQSGKTQARLASNFANNPNKVIANMRKQVTDGIHFNHEKALYNIMNIARAAKLDPTQMGLVFGAVPDVFGMSTENLDEEWVKTMMAGKGMTEQQIADAWKVPAARKSWLEDKFALNRQELKTVAGGIAAGETQIWFESRGGPGAGKMATIEPRIMELLDAPHFGALGPALKEEISARMAAQYPQRFLEQRELARAMESIVKPGRIEGAVSIDDLFAEIGDEPLPHRAMNVRIGGIGDIYVPSAEQVRGLAAYKTAAGKIVDPQLTHRYADVFEAARRYEAKDITEKAMRGELSKLETELARAYKATVTGKGGLLRNRLPGSVFLTAVEPTLGERLPPDVIGVTKPYAEQMFESMRKTGLYETPALKGQLEAMEEMLMAGGRTRGLVIRHPAIGPYSAQAAQFQLVGGNEAVAMINERMHKAAVFQGQLNEESVSRLKQGVANAFKGDVIARKELVQRGGEVLSNPLRLSPLVGLAGDVDGDIIAAMFAGPQLQKTLTSHLADQNAMDMYEEYAIRSQVLKAKATGGDVTLRQLMAGDVTKLAITESGRLGRLSVGLQQYRAAVLSGAGGLSAAEKRAGLGLLEWMEQTPISSKHIASGQELSMVNLLGSIQTALDKKSAAGIVTATREVMAEAAAGSVAARGSLAEGITTMIQDPGTGEMTAKFIPGIQLEETAENIIRSRRAFEQTRVGKATAAMIRQEIMDRAGGFSTGREAVQALRDPDILAMSSLGGMFQYTEKQTMSQLSTRVGTVLNKLGAAGKSMIPLAKPIGLGLGAAIGIASVLSEPPKVLPPGSTISPLPNLESGTGGAYLGYGEHPEPHTRGEPTARNLVNASPSVRLAQQETPGYRIDIRGRTGEQVDMQNLNAQIRATMGNRTRINSTVRDLRSSLTPQRVSSILRDE